LHDVVAAKWFARSVDAEVDEIGRLLEAGERGRGVKEGDADGLRSGAMGDPSAETFDAGDGPLR
jgi:hypothetical protein